MPHRKVIDQCEWKANWINQGRYQVGDSWSLSIQRFSLNRPRMAAICHLRFRGRSDSFLKNYFKSIRGEISDAIFEATRGSLRGIGPPAAHSTQKMLNNIWKSWFHFPKSNSCPYSINSKSFDQWVAPPPKKKKKKKKRKKEIKK